ncbi:hypothetical protein P7D22_15620 [Lichenihabitans sp. Uapishka_5]|uniref:hypothetical protein n=1 Tax=Lichenihabitans sp. Uapishka_5 TaxID=3037302 RepID=UPI0029E7D3B8|nr:hypothetical protein [Lichenihabitans sp. Uapishka_5]MDX7952599.1 hypothetical protein [Lichenihabitans sp. Uapishka_5]
MDLSAAAAIDPLTVSRVHPDAWRRRLVSGRAGVRDQDGAFMLPPEHWFDSAAPVAVDAVTEAAVADLKPMADVPLAEAIHRYVDED